MNIIEELKLGTRSKDQQTDHLLCDLALKSHFFQMKKIDHMVYFSYRLGRSVLTWCYDTRFNRPDPRFGATYTTDTGTQVFPYRVFSPYLLILLTREGRNNYDLDDPDQAAVAGWNHLMDKAGTTFARNEGAFVKG